MNGEFSNNIFKKTVNGNPLVPAGNLFWGNSQGINFYNNMYYGTLTSNTPYSVGTGTKKGPPNVSKLPPLPRSLLTPQVYGVWVALYSTLLILPHPPTAIHPRMPHIHGRTLTASLCPPPATHSPRPTSPA
jgi:hypothetical protein